MLNVGVETRVSETLIIHFNGEIIVIKIFDKKKVQ
jgi:hypothetical protein